MDIRKLFVKAIVVLAIVNGVLIAGDFDSGLLSNNDYTVSLINDSDIEIQHSKGQARIFRGEFVVFFTDKSPAKKFRYADVGFNNAEKILYHVSTWGRDELKTMDPNQHIMDGFDPSIDRGLEEGRTANYWLAAPYTKLQAKDAIVEDGVIKWVFEKNEQWAIEAKVSLPLSGGEPQLYFTFVPHKKGWYSVGYTGAFEVSPDKMEEMWQPMIWHEKRFPNMSYLTDAFLCPLPSALVTYKNVTVGVLADSKELPFMPIPKKKNSRFGIMVRSSDGMAIPMIFAPILGDIESMMDAGKRFDFKAHLIVYPADMLTTYEYLAKTKYDFRDYRENASVTLNQTCENIIDYCMGPWSQFIPELRGNNYPTDVPGAVKNITGLHPLSLAIITDNEAIYKERARPMVEYGLSRERYLFSTNPKVKGDGTSSRLEGPCVAMSDFTTVFTYSQGRMNNYLKQAKEIYETPVNRSLNLTAQLYGDRWQNALYLYRATGKSQYLDAAIKGADEYLRKRVYTKQVDFNDKDSRGMFFWTSFVPQWMELYLLYETTGEKRFLDAAWYGARRYAQFTWFCPAIPDAKVLVNKGGKVPRYRSSDTYKDMFVPEEIVDAWIVSEIGLTPESSPTCHGHRAIYLANQAPWLLRIARDANDKFLRDIARSAVIGRYESFPGYHINAGRTTAHAMSDFANKSLNEMNGVTSLHYNHLWSQVAMIMDYLISDAYYCSDGKIDFPAEYAEGYAYCRSQVYGAKPGKFYDESDVYLYMPKGLAKSSDIQINYIAARGNGNLYIALTNQCDHDVTTTITIDKQKGGIVQGRQYKAKVWKDNKPAADKIVCDGKITVQIKAEGITALVVNGVNICTDVQQRVYAETEPWQKDRQWLDFGNGSQTVLFNMGQGLKSVYSYIKANDKMYKKVTFHYTADGNWHKVTKDSYPFEFTVEIPDDTGEFSFKYEAVKLNGEVDASKMGTLLKRAGM